MNSLFVLATIVSAIAAMPTTNVQHCEKPADIVFVLDSSNSIWRPDFRTQLEFVRNLTRSFDIGPGAEQTRIGLLTFGHEVWPQFQLKDKMDRDELSKAISAIKHGGGRTTNTGDAIDHAITHMFTPEAGCRPNVTRMMIVITDGRSQKTNQTRKAADRAHALNMNVFAIGVGSRIDKGELKAIASQPASGFLFRVDDYTALESITSRLASQTCKVTQLPVISTTTPSPSTTTTATTTTSTTTTTTTMAPKPIPQSDGTTADCGGKPAEVYFIIDASGSIYKEDFEREIEFVQDVVDIFDIGYNKTRVGTMSFSDNARPLIGINNRLDKMRLKQRIGFTEHIGTGTNTAEALRMMRLHGFHSLIAREGVTKVAVVLTDGLSANEEQTKREAELVHAAGITVFAIGIGNGVDLIELKNIASDPNKNYVFQVNDFNSLDTIKEELAIKTCLVEPVNPDEGLKDAPVCSPFKTTDMMFVYDSAAIGGWRSDVISQLIARTVASLDMSSGNLRVGRTTDNCPSGGNFVLSNRLSGNDFAHIHSANFAHLLKKVKRNGFTVENGAVQGSSRMTVMFVDSEMDSLDHHALHEIRNFEKTVEIFAVAIGRSPVINDLIRLVGGNHVIEVGSYESLSNVHDVLVNKLCYSFEQDAKDIDYLEATVV